MALALGNAQVDELVRGEVDLRELAIEAVDRGLVQLVDDATHN